MVRGDLIIATIGVACVLGGCARTVVVPPSWSSVPNGEAMADAYPGFASWIDVSGWAQLRCRSDLLGNLAECRAVKADPAGLGFDRAALSLTPRFKLNPLQRDGEVGKSSVEFTVRFLLPPEESIVPWAGPEPSEEVMALAQVAASRIVESGDDTATGILSDLDVDADRVAVVTRMVERLSADYAARRIESTALMLARSANLTQLRALSEGRRPPGPIPSQATVEAAGPELEALQREFAAELRGVYCARFACSPPSS